MGFLAGIKELVSWFEKPDRVAAGPAAGWVPPRGWPWGGKFPNNGGRASGGRECGLGTAGNY